MEGNVFYLDCPPPFFVVWHPALGPLWDVVRQKIQGGRVGVGSELQLEVAELRWHDVEVGGREARGRGLEMRAHWWDGSGGCSWRAAWWCRQEILWERQWALRMATRDCATDRSEDSRLLCAPGVSEGDDEWRVEGGGLGVGAVGWRVFG